MSIIDEVATRVIIVKPTAASPIKPVVMCDDRARLNSLLAQREMMNNRRATLNAQTQFRNVDDLYTRISIDEYEELISLSIEALCNRKIDT